MKAHPVLFATVSRLLIFAAAIVVLIGLVSSNQTTYAQTTSQPGICSNDKTKACSTNADCGTGNTCYIPTAGGQILNDQVCMQDAAGFGINCTANDVNIAATHSLVVAKGCNFPGDTATISFVAEYNLTAQDRYDIGVWISQDGGNALNGKCSVSDFPTAPTPPWTNLDAAAQPTDTCGDITASNNPLFASVQNIPIKCIDNDGNGLADINTCLSWRQSGANDVCTSPLQAFPGSPSKCKCQGLPGITINIPGVIKVDKVTDPSGSLTSFPFTLTGGPNNINTAFSLTDAAAPYNSGGLLLGTYAVTEAVPQGWQLTGSTCTSDQAGRTPTPGNIVLHNGETVTCTFNDKLVAAPALSLSKQISTTNTGPWSSSITVAGGTPVYYQFTVTNTGNVPLSPVTVTDPTVSTASCSFTSPLPAGQSTACVVGPVTAAALAGTYPNTATASGGYGGTAYNSQPSSASYIVAPAPALSLIKTASPGNYDAVGQVISYTYVVKNTGNIALSGPFTIADDKATNETCPVTSSLAVGDTITCTASYAVTQADLDASKVTNNATATNGTVTSQPATATVFAIAHPNLSLVKTAAPTTYSKVGDVVSYSYVVKNVGNVALSGPFAVADDKATDESCPQPASLAVGASITCTASYTITQADLDSGSVTNIATATATFGGNAVTAGPAQATVNAVQVRALTLDKTAQETTYAKVGDVLHYSYLVTNSGNVTLHDAITVSDNKTTASCPALPAGGLAPGASITCSASYIVTQADLDAGNVTNVASATSGTTTSNTDTVIVPATQTPALSLTKSASPTTYTAAGQTISYSYDLKNTGNVTLSGPFTVTDNKATVTCPAGVNSLAVGDTLTCSASHVVTQAEMDAGSITNLATAAATFGGKAVTSNEVTATVTATQMPALLLAKSASPSTYNAVGQVISYSYVLTNTGNVTLAGPFTVSDDKATVTCPSNTALAPGASITCSASYTITQADLDAGKVTNLATGHAAFGGQPVDSNQDSKTVNALQQGGLGLTKSASPATYSKVGDIVSYTYVVINTGNVTLAGPFTVNDDIVGAVSCPAGSLAPNATVTCTASHTITQANLDAGSVTNHATATDGNLTSNQAQATVNAVQTPALAIDKTAQEATYAKVGDVLHYSYVVTNAGNVTLHDAIIVSDDKATDESCPALPVGGLAPGASITCTASYTVTQADLDAGKVTNVASATSGTTTSPTDTVTVPATQSPALTLKKSANPLTYTTLGQTITYDYLLTNSGNVTLSDPFAVSDDKASVTCPAAVTSLAPNAVLNCTASYTITQADLDNGSVKNIAAATAKFGETTVTSNHDTATVTAVQNPALSLVKSASPSTYDTVGQTISYNYVLTNIGNVTLAGPFTVSDDKVTVTCPADATLAVTTSITCSASYAITQADLDAGTVTNLATAHAAFGGQPVDSNQDTATVTANAAPALSLVKSADPVTYDHVGQAIAYSYVLKNIGNVTLAGPFTVSDDKVTVICPADATLAVTTSITCTASYIITQADLDAGTVTNLASGHGQTLGGTPVNSNDAATTVTADQKPALAIDKSVQETTYVKAGDVLHYSYLVTNSGNVTLHDAILVSDTKTAATCPALPVVGLVPGASITCAASYTITQPDLDFGLVTNVAYASSGSVVSPNDSATVPATQSPALTIDKTAKESTYAAVGDVIHYSYLVTNSGNVTLFNIGVTDNKTQVSCPDTSAGLAPLGTITCTASYTITQSDLDAGSLTNSAYARSGDTQSPPDTVTVPATQAPALSLSKAAMPHFSDPVKVGDTIDYTLTATNTGNITLNNVMISDALLPALICTPVQPAVLAPTQTLVCTGSYAITQANIDAGKVDNTGIAKSDQTPPTETPNEVPVPQAPDISLAKIVTSTGPYTTVGQPITYNLVATNTGNVTLHNVSISDPKLGTLTCTQPVDLAPLATLTCTGTHSVTLNDLDVGKYDNTATVTSSQTEPKQASASVPMQQNPALSLTKVATPHFSRPPKAGDLIGYTLTATNTGNITLNNVTISDALLPTLNCTPSQPATLAPAATLVCTGSYAITQANIDAGKVDNTGIAKSDQTPPTDTPNEVPVPQAPALTIDKTAAETTYAKVGDVLHYSYLVTNSGNVTLYNISVTDNKATVTCPDTSAGLAPLGTVTCTASYTITQSDLDGGSVVNSAYAKSGDTKSPPDTVTVPATQNPALSLGKSADPVTYSKVGDVIAYSYVVTNSGNVTLPGPFTVSDNKLGTISCPTGSLAPAASVTCTASYTIKQSDLDAGSIKNTATASTTYGGKTVTSGPSDAKVTAVQQPALSLTKSASPVTYNTVGNVIVYSYVVKNTGNVTLPGPFTVIDDKATVTCSAVPSGGLAPLATLTCKASYTIKQSDLDAGSVTNTATASTSYGGNTINSNPASATVTAVQNPAITLTKSATPSTYSKVGDVIAYTLVVKNTGNVTLHDVSISDPKLGALTCTPAQPASLAPNAILTCKGSYTIQASDLLTGQINTVTNTATVNGTGPAGQPVSATATATVYQQTGALLPTQTTCQMYAAGPSAWPSMYSAFQYQVKGGKINSVSPGVIFYYNTISAPSAGFTLGVGETNTLNWKPMLVQDLGQVILYNADCSKASGVTVTTTGSTTNPYTVTFTVTGATPGATYYIGIKYSPQNLVGQAVKATGGVYPTSIYSFGTAGLTGSTASIPVKPK